MLPQPGPQASSPTPGQLQRTRSLYLTPVTVAGALVLVWALVTVVGDFPGPIWLALLGVTALTAWAAVRATGFPMTLSLSDAFTVGSTLLYGPWVGALTVACDAAIMSLRLNRARMTPMRLGFNITAPPLALWISSQLLFRVLGQGPFAATPPTPATLVAPLLAFAGIYFLLNSWLIAGAIAVGRPVSALRVWRQHLLPLWPAHAAGTALGGMLSLLVAGAGQGVPIVGWALGSALLIVIGVEVSRHRRFTAVQAELRSCAAALRSTVDAVMLADDEGRVTLLNPTAEQITGWSLADARGRDAAEVLAVTPGEDALAPGEYVLRRRDGSTRAIEETHADIRDEDESISGVIYVFRDISHRKQIDAERHAAFVREQDALAAATAANRLKDEFLATLSHELRTPATAILGWTRLLKGGALNEATSRRALDALDRSARAQAAVLNDIIDESRIIRGTLRLDIRRTQIAEIVNDAVETVEPAAAGKAIEIVVDLGPSLPVIDADPDRLRQVLWNLLANAVKFTPEGGHIAVTARYLGEALQVIVSDDGCGIEADFLPFVFDQFRQEDASPARAHAGLGLGLSIVRHLVEAHGGTVRAESEGRGRGAVFTVTMPAIMRHRAADGGQAPVIIDATLTPKTQASGLPPAAGAIPPTTLPSA